MKAAPHFYLFSLMLLFLQSGCNQKAGQIMLSDTDKSNFKPGQVWNYTTRPGEASSTLTILKVESTPKLGTIVHIRVDNISVASDDHTATNHVSHLPFAEAAVQKSVTSIKQEKAPLPDFTEGYSMWRGEFVQGKAGVFTLTVAEVLETLQKTMAKTK